MSIRQLILLLLLAVCFQSSAQEISTITFAQKRFIVCRVNLAKQPLHLFWRDDAAIPFKSFETLDRWLSSRGRKLIFAMNGGMYHGDFSPVGLYIEDGKELRPLNLNRGEGNFFLHPNGIFAVTRSGACVIESSAYPGIQKSTILATQSGPMLVIDGRLHPAFKPESQSRLFRNGVGIVSPQQVVFAISEEPVNFYQFAQLFRDGLHCKNALFLDGTISSLYSSELKRSDKKMDLGPIIATTDAIQ
jgi:uncharacterized protein YigE (DUF2233 family)